MDSLHKDQKSQKSLKKKNFFQKYLHTSFVNQSFFGKYGTFFDDLFLAALVKSRHYFSMQIYLVSNFRKIVPYLLFPVCKLEFLFKLKISLESSEAK